jgi:hypothetical protein
MEADKAVQGIAPAVMETLARVEETLARVEGKLDRFVAAAVDHWAKEDRRIGLVEQATALDIDLGNTLAGLTDALERQRRALGELQSSVRDEQRTVYSAMRLRLGAQGLERKAKKQP